MNFQNEPKISIIIAIFNVEKYIERCLHSLFNQTLNEIEYIFVDDGSTDNSLLILNRVLKNYPVRQGQVKILVHEENSGIAAARTNGILAATGEYIIHCDPDDYVEKNWAELLLNVAIKQDAEIVICPYFIEKGKRSIIKYPEIKKDGIECALNIFNNVTWRPLWNKLIKSSLIKEYKIIPYKNCNVGEDWSFVIRCLNFTNKIYQVDTPLYHYCIRDNSLSNNSAVSDYLETIEVFIKTYEFLDSCCNTRYEQLSNYFKFIVKMRSRSKFKNKINEWFKFNSECHKSIMTFKDHSLFNRIFLILLLSNMTFYRFFMKFKKIRASIFTD